MTMNTEGTSRRAMLASTGMLGVGLISSVPAYADEPVYEEVGVSKDKVTPLSLEATTTVLSLRSVRARADGRLVGTLR